MSLRQYRTTHVVRNRPLLPEERSQFALVVLGFLVVMLAATCSACLTNAMLPKSALRSANEQHIATVMLRTTCEVPQAQHVPTTGDSELDALLDKIVYPPKIEVYGGSGVLVSKNRALTNVHVITCDDGKVIGLEARAGDGEPWIKASAEILLPEYDIARVRLASDAMAAYFTPIEIGPRPVVGERICMSTAVPLWTYRCAEVQPATPGFLPTSLFVVHGNSGSGSYVGGKLVGLIRAVQYCEGGAACVGWVTPLQGWDWLIP